jgi:hypothetical protein
MLGGLVWSKPAVDQLKADKQAAEAQRNALIETYETQVIPVLTDVQREFIPATSAMAKAVASLKAEGSKERRELRQSVEVLQAQINTLTVAMSQLRDVQRSTPPPSAPGPSSAGASPSH